MCRKAIIFSIAFIVGQLAFQPVSGLHGDAGELKPSGTKGSVMVVVPDGNFKMGINPATDERYGDWDDEKPFHEVYLDEFYIDKYEATVDQYNQCARAGKCERFRKSRDRDSHRCNWVYPGRGNRPMNCVNWHHAMAFCEWAGKTLPTEAQWEKAARGTDGRKFPWGNEEADCDHAVFNEKGTMSSADWGCETGITFPVGSKPAGASPYGAMDMAGNVAEWAADWYYDDYYRKAPQRNPKGPQSGNRKVIRGGGWNEYDIGIRTTFRSHDVPDGYNLTGVRCAFNP